MRLNHVESFNAFTARTTGRRGWSWLAARGNQLRPTPPTGASGCSQGPPTRGLLATFKGRPTPSAAGCGQPAGEATSDALARDGRQRPARKRLPTTHPQGAAASRGDDVGRRGGRPLAVRLSAVMRSVTACAGAAAAQEGEGEG
ncbi:hypothetical protein BHE74_00043033 [Ensete ventricosum]|nr:hypothetical protein BHE74_00043033 [Ensete ventricosum]